MIDDDPHLTRMVELYFKDSEFELVSVKNGRVALQTIQQRDFDVVLLDIQMPEMDGITMLQKVPDEIKEETPFIILTAHGPIEDAIKAIEYGAYDILQKPFERQRLLLTIRNALKYQTLRQQYVKLKTELEKKHPRA